MAGTTVFGAAGHVHFRSGVWMPGALGTTPVVTTGTPKMSVDGTGPVSVGGVSTGVRLAGTATGLIRTGATAGDLRLWAQNATHASTSTMYADFYLQVTPVM